MKLSVIIPHHYGLDGTDEILSRCIKSLVGYNELIIVANDGIGYGPAVNKGLKMATGDHMVVINNDTYMIQGTMRDLALNNVVGVPLIDPPARDHNPRCFFCVPRIIYEEIVEQYGYFFDERFEVGYFEDDDLIARLQELSIESRLIESVKIHHQDGGGFSMKQMGEEKFYDLNKERFLDKWGR